MKRITAAVLVVLALWAGPASGEDSFPPFLTLKSRPVEVPGSVKPTALVALDLGIQFQVRQYPPSLAQWRKTLPVKYRTATHVTTLFLMDCETRQWMRYSVSLLAGRKLLGSWPGGTWFAPNPEDLEGDRRACAEAFGEGFDSGPAWGAEETVPPVSVAPPTTVAKPSSTSIPEGEWLVNKEVTPGVYRTTAPSCYWARYRAFSGTGRIIDNGNTVSEWGFCRNPPQRPAVRFEVRLDSGELEIVTAFR